MTVKNSTSRERDFSKFKRKAWDKTIELRGHPSDIWRRDKFGHVINWQQYRCNEELYGCTT